MTMTIIATGHVFSPFVRGEASSGASTAGVFRPRVRTAKSAIISFTHPLGADRGCALLAELAGGGAGDRGVEEPRL
jgi:hypothetical protein